MDCSGTGGSEEYGVVEEVEVRGGLVDKWRLTTDDSMEADESVASRNAGIDRNDMGTIDLLHVRSLARAVAVVQARAGDMGICLEEWGMERLALWALDLTNAYRMMAAARHDRWMQQFIWFDGVCLDTRCEFGTAHMVDLFERVTTFVLEVAKWRIREYDRRHPYGRARSAWQRWRRAQARFVRRVVLPLSRLGHCSGESSAGLVDRLARTGVVYVGRRSGVCA